MKKKITITVLAFWLLNGVLWSQQDKYLLLQEKLTTLSASDIPSLNEQVNISVTNIPIQEFLRGVANSAGLNINVDPNLQINVVNNFSNVKVIDILLFLCRQYELNISVIGNIINLTKEKPEPPSTPQKVIINYDNSSGIISIQCDNEDLSILAREIIDKTGRNVVPAAGLDKTKVSGYIQKMAIDNALDKFAYANNLKIRKTDDNVFLIEKNDPALVNTSPNPQRKDDTSKKKSLEQNEESENIDVKLIRGDSLSVISRGGTLTDIINQAANQIKVDYFFTSDIKGVSTFTLRGVSFSTLLEYLFRNTNYTFQIRKGIYLIGENKSPEMKDFKVIQLQNRTVEKLTDVIPTDLKTDMDLKEFPELNSILVGGLPYRIELLETFLRSIDKLVPVVLIEIMIVDSKKSHNISTGIDAGLGEQPAKTKGTVYPGVDMTLNSQSINNLLNSFNGYGAQIIGQVTPNFYMTIKALENNGTIDIRSTPRLSTINGHEANIKIGNTQYYKKEMNNLYGSLSTQSQTITSYEPVEAKMSIKIKPAISGDDQITLEIEVTQEDFTDRIEKYAPPGKVSREFKSLIRVKNQDMILLGGLEENRDQDTGSGLPLLSRIPIVKWLFSSKTSSKSKSKLNIFIKPTIIN